MSKQDPMSKAAITGTIRRRLLVNAVVEPDEAAGRLPEGLRPHVTPRGTIVGICLLEIDKIRPAVIPRQLGMHLRSVAHRIAVEWEDSSGATVVGVYVPVRHTDSRLAHLVGGRWQPGVQELARMNVVTSNGQARWESVPHHDEQLHGIRLVTTLPPDARAHAVCDLVGASCLDASVGLSPDRHGVLEGARLESDHRHACEVVVDELDSPFLASFSSARASTSLLMRDVEATWTRASAPANLTAAPA